MAVRPDVRLETAPMEPVSCHTCAAQVEVRKSSWEQTSIQWHADAVEACLERRAASPRPGPNGAAFRGCGALSDSVREAAVTGSIHVVTDEPLLTNPEAAHHEGTAAHEAPEGAHH